MKNLNGMYSDLSIRARELLGMTGEVVQFCGNTERFEHIAPQHSGLAVIAMSLPFSSSAKACQR